MPRGTVPFDGLKTVTERGIRADKNPEAMNAETLESG
jgi:hypothetical protein